MKKNSKMALLLVLCVITLSCTDSGGKEPKIPEHTFLMGNSLTYYNRGVGTTIVDLAASAKPPVTLDQSAYTKGGATLQQLYHSSGWLPALKTGRFDTIILQDTIVD